MVAIFTKFDVFITKVYDEDLDEEQNRELAKGEVQNKFQTPLEGYKYPPRAYVRMEGIVK